MSVVFNGTEVTDIVMDETPLEFLIYNDVFVFGGEYAYLKTGREINAILSDFFNYYGGPTTIEFVSTQPSSSYTKGPCISVENSPKACYIYYTSSAIQIYADDNAYIFFNKDSSYMFYQIALENTMYPNKALDIISCTNRKVRTDLVQNMDYMFSNMSMYRLTKLEFCLNFNNVTTANHMFDMGYTRTLDIIPVYESLALKAPVLTSANSMFERCQAATINGLTTFSAPKLISADRMFYGDNNLTSLELLNFEAPLLESATDIFDNCGNLETLRIPKLSFKNVPSSDKHYMFRDIASNNTPSDNYDLSTLDISSFDTSNMTDMSYMFYKLKGLTSLSLNSFDTSNVTKMNYMFGDCAALTSLDVSEFNTENVEMPQGMFSGCSALVSLNVSGFNLSKSSNFYRMFGGCSALTSLNLEGFSTPNATTFDSMFSNCSALTSLDLSSFDTSNVTDMSSMFAGCRALTSLDLSNFDTSNVTGMGDMFRDFRSMETLDLSDFDTSNVENMDRMFSGSASNVSSSLITIYVSDKFVTSKVTSSYSMFVYATNLVGGKGTVYDSNHVDKEYARIDDPDNGKPGYFTEKAA